MWHLFSVLRWAQADRKRGVDATLADLARLTMSVNVAIGEREADCGEVERVRALNRPDRRTAGQRASKRDQPDSLRSQVIPNTFDRAERGFSARG